MPKSKNPTTIQFSDFKEPINAVQQLGSNLGGFFTHKGTEKQYYIKWLPKNLLDKEKQFFKQEDLKKGKYANRHRNRFINEVLAARIYELYGVSVPKMEFITFVDDKGVTNYGISSEKKDGIKMIRDATGDNFKKVSNKAQEDFLIDVLLSNYDVVGSSMDNMFYNPNTKEPLRLDPGAALRYYAQGKAKKGELNAEVGEYEDMEAGKRINTQFNPGPLGTCGLVFNGVSDSPALLISLKKLSSITDKQLRDCVEEHGFDIDNNGKGLKKNEAIITQLLERKQSLIAKAESRILDRLMNGLKGTKDRSDYLQKAGLPEKEITTICMAIETNKSKEEIGLLIQAAINPSLKKDATASHKPVVKPTVEQVQVEKSKPAINFDFSDEKTHFNQIVKGFLHSRAFLDHDTYPGNYLGNTKGSDQIQRVKHGGMHASRTALHSEKIISLLDQAGYEPVAHLTQKDRFLIKVAAMFHDTGRGIDSGNDQQNWELDGGENARNWLKEKGFSTEDADKVHEAIAHKDDKQVQAKNVYALVLAGSDSLDWVRSHSSNFNATFMPDIIKQYIPQPTLTQLGLVAKKIAIDQGDSPVTDGQILGNFNIATKKTYEHNLNGCYTAVKDSYSKFSSELDQVRIPKKENVDSPSTDNTQQTAATVHFRAKPPVINNDKKLREPKAIEITKPSIDIAKQSSEIQLVTKRIKDIWIEYRNHIQMEIKNIPFFEIRDKNNNNTKNYKLLSDKLNIAKSIINNLDDKTKKYPQKLESILTILSDKKIKDLDKTLLNPDIKLMHEDKSASMILNERRGTTLGAIVTHTLRAIATIPTAIISLLFGKKFDLVNKLWGTKGSDATKETVSTINKFNTFTGCY